MAEQFDPQGIIENILFWVIFGWWMLIGLGIFFSIDWLINKFKKRLTDVPKAKDLTDGK